MIYLDSSAYVKIYLDEVFSDKVRQVVSESKQIFCAELGFVEVRAALAAAHRLHRIHEDELTLLKDKFTSQWEYCHQIEIDSALIVRAADLAEYGGLRGYDAMHLAAAERLKLGGILDLHFLCFDHHLVRAAKMLGITCTEFK